MKVALPVDPFLSTAREKNRFCLKRFFLYFFFNIEFLEENMPAETQIMEKYVAAAITLGIAVLIGLFIQFFVNTRLHKIAKKTPWKGDEIIIEGLKGRIILWSVIIGLYSALPILELPPTYNIIIQKALLILAVLSITLAASSILSGFIRVYSGEFKGEAFSTSIFAIFSRIVVMSIGFMIILQTLNISITPILTALGVGGLAVALALQDTLGNFFAGLNILVSGKVKVGDYIKLQSGEEGYVVDITWRNTTIRQLADNFVIIPNSKLATTITTNFNLPSAGFTVSVQAGVSYDSDLEKVERVAIEVAKETMKEVNSSSALQEPRVRFHAFGDSSVNMNVYMNVEEYSKQLLIRHRFIIRLHRRFKEEGIVIPYPIRTIELGEGSEKILSNNKD
jgi:small-conductance mechanosensitive channel